MQRKWKLTGGIGTAMGLAVTAVVATAGSAAASAGVAEATKTTTSSTLPYICRTRFAGEWIPVEYSRDFTTTAPAKVLPNQHFNVVFDSAPIKAVADYNKLLNSVSFNYRVPSEAKVVSYRLTGGSNVGTAKFWVERSGTDLRVKSDGEWPGGYEFDFPNLEVVLKAPKSAATLTTGAGGSSFTDTSFGWYRLQPVTNEWDPFQCYADPAKPVTFSNTVVGY
ncbi:hypothetical protein [Streptomyces heilongjiangensis]|uniref:Dehydratase n=1 Tax=Streptomyces heilongjiangensis TaxID=945052 RepID=A0ABW1BBH7_9ACTN|nr:hypothetical protein [Streptomyces heilongjiangensis]MDC2948760.1 hypothetical protein [Streptomyces heilongjiangensis]